MNIIPSKYRIILTVLVVFVSAGPLPAQTNSERAGLIVTPDGIRLATAQTQPKGIIASEGAAPGDGISESRLPRRVDLSRYLPPIGSQGMIESCSAWSTVYYAKTIQENQEHEWGADSPSHQFSPLFSYNQITRGRNEGTSIDDHMLIIQNMGAVPLSEFPYTEQINMFPNDETIARAEPYRGESYRKLSEYNWNTQEWTTDINTVKTVLAEGSPVVGGFLVHDSFYAYQGGIYSHPVGAELGGHAMCVVGYDDDKRAFLIVNSWGEDWGEDGFMWMSYDLFSKLNTSGCLVMIDSIDSKAVKLEPPTKFESSKGAHTDRIELSWSPVETADSYTVYRVNNENGEFRKLGETTATVYSNNSLPPGVNYIYAVKSVRRNGAEYELSGMSEISEGWTSKGKSTPGIPSNVTCEFYRKMPLVMWNPVDDAEGYNVYRWNHEKEDFFKIGETDDSLFLDHTYRRGERMEMIYYVVQAYNGYGAGYAADAASMLYHPRAREVTILEGTPNDDRITPPMESTPFQGEYYRTDYFDYEYTMRRFREFYETEQAAFRAYRENEQSEFEAWKQRQREGAGELR